MNVRNKVLKYIENFVIDHDYSRQIRYYTKASYNRLLLVRYSYIFKQGCETGVMLLLFFILLLLFIYHSVIYEMNVVNASINLHCPEALYHYSEVFNMVGLYVFIFVVLYVQIFRGARTHLTQPEKRKTGEGGRLSIIKLIDFRLLLSFIELTFIIIIAILNSDIVDENIMQLSNPSSIGIILVGIIAVLLMVIFVTHAVMSYITLAAVTVLFVFFVPFYILINNYMVPNIHFSLCLFASTLTMLVLWLIVLFIGIPLEMLKMRRRKMNIINRVLYHLIYIRYFTSTILLNDIATVIGTLIYIVYSLSSLLVFTGDLLPTKNISLLDFWAMITTYLASLILAYTHVLDGTINIRSLFANQFNKYIRDNVMAKVGNHTVVIGVSDLGRRICQSIITNMCAINRSYLKRDKSLYAMSPVKPFRIFVDDRLNICLVSNRLIVVDANPKVFNLLKDDNQGDYSIGLYKAFTDHSIYILGICGSIEHPSVRSFARIELADLLVYTHDRFNENYEIGRLEKPEKKIISTVDTPTFQSIVTFGYGKPMYNFNSDSIEGISISQRIIQHINRGVASSILKHKYPRSALNRIQPIILMGEGKVIFYTIQAIYLSILSQVDDIKFTKYFIDNKFVVFSNDTWFNEETRSQGRDIFSKWEFFPVRYESSNPSNEMLSIRIYRHTTFNYENIVLSFMELFHMHDYPGLIVILNNKANESIEIVNRVVNAMILLKKSYVKGYHMPLIISSCNYKDRTMTALELMKYNANVNASLFTTYPKQHPKDSLLNRYIVSGHQMGTLASALIQFTDDDCNPSIIKDHKNNDVVVELSFCVSEKAGILAKMLCDLYGWRTQFSRDLIPSFSFCYTYNVLHDASSFVFTGTAYLSIMQENKHYLKDWCMNCIHPEGNNKHDSEILNKIMQHIDINDRIDPNYTKEACLRRFSDCVISSYSMYNKHRTINHTHGSDVPFKRVNTTRSKTLLFNSIVRNRLMVDEKVHFKIWAGPNNQPGVMAKTLCDTLRLKLVSNDHPKQSYNYHSIVPLIEFSNSIPCCNSGNTMQTIYTRFCDLRNNTNTSDLFYELFCNNIPPIKAIKIKLSNALKGYNNKWLDYAINEVTYLNDLYYHIECNSYLYTLLLIYYEVIDNVLCGYVFNQEHRNVAVIKLNDNMPYHHERNIESVIDKSETRKFDLTRISELVILKTKYYDGFVKYLDDPKISDDYKDDYNSFQYVFGL